jgi:stage V sporulation protein D (sporulation-specific penicillin-binding protein)
VLERPSLLLKRRTFLTMVGATAFNLLLMGRVVYIQGSWARHLKTLAEEAHLRGVPLAPLRGRILDRTGRVLAESYNQYSAYAVPVQVTSKAEEAVLLATILGLPQERVRQRLSRRLGFVWLKRKLSDAEANELRAQAAALPGVYLAPEAARDYPEGDFAGPVLGFTGVDNQGLSGLEFTYNRYLEGRRGWILQENDVLGQPVPGAASRLEPPVPGDTLVTTLDENIQWMAERVADETRLRHGAKRVMLAVVDPNTGGVLAMANRPGFNPNDYREAKPSQYRNYVVSDAIPPGSIFKPVTLASALESGAVGRYSGFFCPGFRIVLGRRVNCWRKSGHGPESLSDVVKNSCNVGFMDMGLRLGLARFYEYLDWFRVSGPSGIDLPGEARGIRAPEKRATALDLAVMAFGQTLTVTPIALLNAVAALANGGELLIPHVAERIVAPDGRVVKDFHRRVVRRVVKPWVAEAVQQMMVRVVTEGTGKLAQVPGYRVAGKTGTAQKVINGRVSEGVYIASFIGFAPVPHPKVAVLCSVDEPVGAYYGGQVAAPAVGRLLRQLLPYLGVPRTVPIRPPRPGEPAIVPNLVNLSPRDAEADAAAFGFPVRFRGHGPVVVDQSVEYGGYLPAGTPLVLTLGAEPRIYLEWVAVPEVVGLTVGDARHVAFDIGINLHVEGNLDGRVAWQAWPPNREVRAGSTMTVRAV